MLLIVSYKFANMLTLNKLLQTYNFITENKNCSKAILNDPAWIIQKLVDI